MSGIDCPTIRWYIAEERKPQYVEFSYKTQYREYWPTVVNLVLYFGFNTEMEISFLTSLELLDIPTRVFFHGFN